MPRAVEGLKQTAGESQRRRLITGMEETGPEEANPVPTLLGVRPQALPMMFVFPMVSGRVQVGLNLLGSSDCPASTSCVLRPVPICHHAWLDSSSILRLQTPQKYGFESSLGSRTGLGDGIRGLIRELV